MIFELLFLNSQGRCSDTSTAESGSDIDSSPIRQRSCPYPRLAPVHEEVSFETSDSDLFWNHHSGVYIFHGYDVCLCILSLQSYLRHNLQVRASDLNGYYSCDDSALAAEKVIESDQFHPTLEQSLQTNDMGNVDCRTKSEGIVVLCGTLVAHIPLYLDVEVENS